MISSVQGSECLQKLNKRLSTKLKYSQYERQTAPTDDTILPIATCRLQVRVEGSDEDALLSIARASARLLAERYTGYSFHSSNHTFLISRWPGEEEGNRIFIPFYPVTSVTTVEYYADGSWHTLDASNYSVDVKSKPCTIRFNDTESYDDDVEMPIRITCVAGIAEASVPDSAKSAMLLVIGHLYNNREHVVTWYHQQRN